MEFKNWLEDKQIHGSEFENEVNKLNPVEAGTIGWNAAFSLIYPIMKEIHEISNHEIPFYAFGDNEAGCDMNNILKRIRKLSDESLSEYF